MARLLESVKSCIYKSPSSQQVEFVTDISDAERRDGSLSPAPSSSSSVFSYSSKKTDEKPDSSTQPAPGIMWRATSGVYSTASSALSAGVGSIRWVAGRTYDVGAAVASKVPVPRLPVGKKKDKNE